MTRVLLPVISLLVVAGTLLFWWSTNAVPPVVSRTTARPGSTVPISVGSMPSHGDDASAEGSVEDRTPANPNPKPGSPAAKGNSILLTVVDRSSERPVPDADVFFAIRTMESVATVAEQELLEELSVTDGEAYARRLGTVIRTDQAGQTYVPRFTSSKHIYARSGGRQGRLVIDPRQKLPATGLRLLISGDFSPRITVVDAQSRPVAGAKVLARIQNESNELEILDFLSAKTTAPDGVAVLNHLHNAFYRQRRAHQAPLHISAFCSIPGYVSDSKIIYRQGDPVDAGEARFQLPPTGRVAIRVVDHAGNPIRSVFKLTVRPVGARHRDRLWRDTTAEDGALSLPYVALTPSLILHAVAGNILLRAELKGPRAPGSTAHVDLKLSESQVILSGRAIDSKGAPVASAFLYGPLQVGTKDSFFQTNTDSQGRFRLFLPDFVSGQRIEKLSFAVFGLRTGATALGAEVLLEAPLTPGEHALGDVHFDYPPALGSGRIEGGAGHIDYQLYAEVWDETQSKWLQKVDMQTRFLGTDRFEIVGRTTANRFRLQVRSWMYEKFEPLEFRRGDSDLHVKLQRGGAVRVTVAADLSVPQSSVQLRLLPSAGELGYRPYSLPGLKRMYYYNREFSLPESKNDNNYVAVFNGVRPGVYDLFAYLVGSPRIIKTIARIEVKAGTYAEDPRISPLDLRGQVKVVTVVAKTSTGKPINNGGLFVVTRQPGTALEGQRFQLGRATLLLEKGTQSLRAIVPGFEPQPIVARSGEQRITMRRHPTQPTTINLTDGLPELPAGTSLQVKCTARGNAASREYSLQTSRGTAGNGKLSELTGAPTLYGTLDQNGRVVLELQIGATYDLLLQRIVTGELSATDLALPATATGGKKADIRLTLRKR